MNRWVDGWVDGYVDGWIDGWTDGWADGWADGQMDRWTDVPVVIQNRGPYPDIPRWACGRVSEIVQ